MNAVLKRILSVVCAVALVATAAPFSASVTAATDTIFKETFQSYDDNDTVPGWTLFNTDGDGYCWYIDKNYNGNVRFISASANSSGEFSTNEYLMTPAVTIPSSVEANYMLSFGIANNYPWGSDTISVYVSTEAVTDPTTLTADACVYSQKHYGGTYELVTVEADLNAYRGQTVYILFHHVASRSWQFELDDVTVYAETANRFPVEFETVDPLITVIPESGSLEAIDGQDYSFTLNIPSSMAPQNATVTVTANDEPLTAVDGVYTIPAVTKKQDVYVDMAYTGGDVYPDKNVNMRDVMILYDGLSGNRQLNAVQLAAGKVHYYDGDTVMRDVMWLYSYVSGKRSYIDTNKDVSLIWKSTYADATNGFSGVSSVTDAAYYINNKQKKDFSAPTSLGDCKQIFYNSKAARVVNLADGYAVTLPFTDFKADYSLSALRSRYEGNDFVLNISAEDQNPYGNSAGSWNTYLTEWLNRFIADDSFLSRNNISRVRASSESTTKLSGYTVLTYDLLINDNANIEMPYYHIAVIRKTGEYVKFHLLVMKSKTNRSSAMDTIVKSFKQLTAVGTPANALGKFECEVPYFWNDETVAYYDKLQTQSATDWGFFSASMTDSGDSSYTTNGDKIQSEYDRLSTAMDYDYEIMPTYTHIAWGNDANEFPAEHAERFAGGNGFNGKPVLQLTYQFTTSNNTNLNGYTPMFDILRGDYEAQFRRLARDIKAYGKPVLFRLNNEMNTDWTSYSGIVTLLDPDIFIETWEYLYDIFIDEGVDNCIWIFNPIATTTPYCAWGEYLNFMPDEDYVQALGLTSYEMGNDTTLRSFEDHYRTLYQKNTPYYDDYPWIISEFAAGAGGEKSYDWNAGKWVDTTLGRNHAAQAQWVEDMFECFAHRDEKGYEFVKNIKGAVWFSVNDYAYIDDVSYISNYLALDKSLTKTIAAFKKGLAE